MNTNKTVLVSAAVIIALALVISPLVMGDDALAKKHKHKHKSNHASQSISQSQRSSQNSQVVSGGNTIGSGNNVNVQVQSNSGNNALGQQ